MSEAKVGRPPGTPKTGGRRPGSKNKPKHPTSVDTIASTPVATAGAAAPPGGSPALVMRAPASAPAREAPPQTAPAGLKIRYESLDNLREYERNANEHPPAQIALIERLLAKFGWTTPMGKASGVLIYGHARRQAALNLRDRGVVIPNNPDPNKGPVVDLSHLSKIDRRLYVIADNESARKATTNAELLALEVQELGELGADVSLTGLDDGQLAALRDSDSEGLTDPDAVPPVPAVPVSLVGDVWVLGKHRLYCANCMDVLPTLTGIDAVVTDQPYGSGFVRGGQSVGKFSAGGQSPNWDVWNTDWIASVSAKTIAAFCPCSRLGDLITAFGGGQLRFYIKTNPRPPLRGADAPSVEPIVVFPRVLFGDGPQHFSAYNGDNEHHPTQKPVAIMEWLVKGVAAPASTIADPFAGSGTTIIAAEMTGRACHAIELSPAYVDVAVKRWQAFTGAEATLESTGQTFAETEASRAAPAKLARVKARVKVAA